MEFFGSIVLGDSHAAELENYWRQDWRRFVYTFGLVSHLQGRCLELGANPYFTTALLQHYTQLDLTLANYFGPHFRSEASQEITLTNPGTGQRESQQITFAHFNIEEERFPFADAAFDIVLLCEVIEHLQSDPVSVLREIKRILRSGGHLILTTPNVSRLENVARMLAGVNIYDPYSGYGPYGRHNREYNKHDLAQLLDFCGFDIEVLFSADVHANRADDFYPAQRLIDLVRSREYDLGQYLFVRARNSESTKKGRPAWLYRSYPPGELQS